MKTPDLRTKLQKKAEVKLQAVGKKVGTKIRTVKKAYDSAVEKSQNTPKAKKLRKQIEGGLRP